MMSTVHKNRLTTRVMRDVNMRCVAKAKDKESWKKLPKQLRTNIVHKQRNSAMAKRVLEPQGLGTMAAAALVGAVTATSTACFQGFKDVVHHTKRVADRVTGVLDNVDSIKNTATRMCDAVHQALEGFKNHAIGLVGDLWVLPIIAVGFYLVGKYVDNNLARLAIFGALSLIMGDKLWCLISPLINPIKSQGLGGIENDISKAIATAMCFSFLPEGGQKLVPTLMSRFSQVDRSSKGIEEIFKFVLDIAERMVNYILSAAKYKDESGNQRYVVWGDCATRMIKLWVKQAFELTAPLAVGQPTIKTLKKVEEHLRAGYVILQQVNDPASQIAVKRHLDALEAKLAPFKGALAAGKNFRVEPLFLLLVGATGVGKSSLLIKAASTMLIVSGLAERGEVMSSLFQKGSSEYWNGYVNQKCLIMDDVFQQKCASGATDSEFMDIIRMIGNWTCPLNMADLNSKGRFFFDSELVIGTSNAMSIRATTAGGVVEAPEAVARRIHKCLDLTNSPEFRNERGFLDYDKVDNLYRQNLADVQRACKLKGTAPTDEDIISCVPWHAWEVYEHNWVTGLRVSGPIDLKAMIIQMGNDLRRRREEFEQSLETMNLYNELLYDSANTKKAPVCHPPIHFPDFTATVEEITPAVGATVDEEDQEFFEVSTGEPLDIEDVLRITQSGIDMRSFSSAASSDDEEITCGSDADSLLRQWWLKKESLRKATTGVAEPSIFRMSWLRRADVPPAPQAPWSPEADIDFSEEDEDALEQADRTWSDVRDICARMCLRFATFAREHPIISIFAGVGLGVAATWVFSFMRDVVGGLIKSVYDMVVYIFRGTGECEAQSNVKHGGLSPATKTFRFKPVKQSYDGVQEEHTYNMVYRNTWKLHCANGPIGQILFIEEQVAVCPLHFFGDIKKLQQSQGDEYKLVLQHCGSASVVHVTVRQFLDMRTVEFEGQDIAFFRFPRASNMVTPRCITRKFIPEAAYDVATRAQGQVRLDICRLNPVKGGHDKVQNVVRTEGYTIEVDQMVGTKRCNTLLRYQGSTQKGDCGAPFMIADERHHLKGAFVLGIHIAGSSGVVRQFGYANPVTRDMVEYALKELKVTIKDNFFQDMEERGFPVNMDIAEPESGLVEAGLVAGSFSLLGEIPQAANMPCKSKIKFTELKRQQIFGDCGTKPAHLRAVEVDGVLKHPMVEAVRPYQTPLVWREHDNLSLVISVATAPFRKASLSHTRAILTFEEAVQGPELLKLKAINRSTSSGFPYIFDVRNGKKDFFGYGDEFEYTSAPCLDLKARVEYVIESAKRGERLAHVCFDFLKDEVRSVAKVDAVQTRLISGSPLDYVLACRMYFGSFQAAMFENHTVSGMAPGINPYQDWSLLASRLVGKGKKVFDGDFKGFDTSEQPYVHWAILDFINAWYDDGSENAKIREVLWMDLVHSRHLTGLYGEQKYIVQWSKSLPSGHPMTTAVNSLYSLITMVGCYAAEFGSPMSYWDHVFTATFGDDNISSADDATAERFNINTLKTHMKDLYDLTYTNGSKDASDLRPYKTISECTFLKRTFLADDSGEVSHGGWSAPLDIKSFLYTSYYYKNNANIEKELISKLEGTLGEMCLHGQDLWDEYAGAVVNLMREQFGHEPLPGVDRSAWRHYTFSQDDFWF